MKVESLIKGKDNRASIVIGFSEKNKITLQMRGEIRLIKGLEELEEAKKIHFDRHPFSKKYFSPETVFIEFTPKWWRYTDFNIHPELVIESD